MNNFKNLKELYQALLDGKTIVCENGAKAKMINDDFLEVDQGTNIAKMRLGDMRIIAAENWSTYQEPVKWFRAIAHNKEDERPIVYLYLYKNEEDFLKLNAAKKEDYHWIILEEVKL